MSDDQSNVTEASDINQDVQEDSDNKELVVENKSKHESNVQIIDANSTSKQEIKVETSLQDAPVESEEIKEPKVANVVKAIKKSRSIVIGTLTYQKKNCKHF